ncbi:MAG: hypothetical protein Q7S33_04015 [Nanoarchaeota archaeon]|nr:hypothetical protein [Nanoarchaeota archaeon]
MTERTQEKNGITFYPDNLKLVVESIKRAREQKEGRPIERKEAFDGYCSSCNADSHFIFIGEQKGYDEKTRWFDMYNCTNCKNTSHFNHSVECLDKIFRERN